MCGGLHLFLEGLQILDFDGGSEFACHDLTELVLFFVGLAFFLLNDFIQRDISFYEFLGVLFRIDDHAVFGEVFALQFDVCASCFDKLGKFLHSHFDTLRLINVPFLYLVENLGEFQMELLHSVVKLIQLPFIAILGRLRILLGSFACLLEIDQEVLDIHASILICILFNFLIVALSALLLFGIFSHNLRLDFHHSRFHL